LPHGADSVSDGHVDPVSDFCVTVLVRVFIPPSHVFEHFDHFPQPDTLQFTGQEPKLHGTSRFLSVEHASPPSRPGRITVRTRFSTPAPHETLHGVVDRHPERMQSTGHGSALHEAISYFGPQPRPPYAAGTAMLRSWLRVPLPQEREHALHAPHGDILQSTEQPGL
jgi:hypothetical protein